MGVLVPRIDKWDFLQFCREIAPRFPQEIMESARKCKKIAGHSTVKNKETICGWVVEGSAIVEMEWNGSGMEWKWNGSGSGSGME